MVNFTSIEAFKEARERGLIFSNPKIDSYPISFQTLRFYKSPSLPIPLIPIISVRADNERDLKKSLGKIISYKTLVMVDSTDKSTLEVAARDGRVDLLSVYDIEHIQSLSKGILSLAKQNKVTLSISITPVIRGNNTMRSRVLREIYKLFKQFKVNTNRYSLGAYTDDQWLFRGPMEKISILISLLDVPHVWAKKMVSEHNENLMFRWMNRDLGLFIEDKIRIVEIKEPDNNGKGV